MNKELIPYKEALLYFFGGAFNQDWGSDFNDGDAVIIDFLNTTHAGLLLQLKYGITVLLNLPEDAIRKVIYDDNYCSYQPEISEGKNLRDWLAKLLKLLDDKLSK
jgi:hypothetical protein